MLHNILTDERLNLFCLVDGEITSNAFSVKASVTETVDDLKGAITAKTTPMFDDIATNELTLWRVSVKDGSDDDLPIVFETLSEKTKLRATSELSEVFEGTPPKKTIHIIIQRPPQGDADSFIFVFKWSLSQHPCACSLS